MSSTPEHASTCEIFLHRAQRWGNGRLLTALAKLESNGVRAFELDLMRKPDGSICFGHPRHPDKWYEESPAGLSAWASDRDVRILLDLKEPASWEPDEERNAQFFSTLSNDHFLVASYDLIKARMVGERFGLRVCHITAVAPTEEHQQVLLILPPAAALGIQPQRRPACIVSDIKAAAEVALLRRNGFLRFITDDIIIATRPAQHKTISK